MIKIKSQEDFWTGLMFIGFGVLAVVVAQGYPMGAAIRMGPGYFPTYLGAIAIVIGAIVTAFVSFGLLIERAGFVPALLALIIMSSLAGRDSRLLELVLLALVLIGGSVALFIYGLELPYALFPWS